MPINKSRIKPFETNKFKNVTSKNVERVNMDLLLTLNETTNLIQKEKCKDAVPYILWNDFTNANGTLAPKTNKTYNRYVWGEKIFVNFGMTNIQTELSYPHPAIVLYNFANTVIVVPTTSDDKSEPFSQDIEECIIKVKKDGQIFPNDTIINLHQICSIHKERIISDLKCNVKNYIVDKDEIQRLNQYESFRLFSSNMNLLDCIRVKLISIFHRDFLDNILLEEAYNINDILDLKTDITELKDENEKLKKEMKNLKTRLDNKKEL